MSRLESYVRKVHFKAFKPRPAASHMLEMHNQLFDIIQPGGGNIGDGMNHKPAIQQYNLRFQNLSHRNLRR
jgi:hypothetical protein